jgi:hypothetical protein
MYKVQYFVCTLYTQHHTGRRFMSNAQSGRACILVLKNTASKRLSSSCDVFTNCTLLDGFHCILHAASVSLVHNSSNLDFSFLVQFLPVLDIVDLSSNLLCSLSASASSTACRIQPSSSCSTTFCMMSSLSFSIFSVMLSGNTSSGISMFGALALLSLRSCLQHSLQSVPKLSLHLYQPQVLQSYFQVLPLP